MRVIINRLHVKTKVVREEKECIFFIGNSALKQSSSKPRRKGDLSNSVSFFVFILTGDYVC